jgi:hypothetical protein
MPVCRHGLRGRRKGGTPAGISTAYHTTPYRPLQPSTYTKIFLDALERGTV